MKSEYCLIHEEVKETRPNRVFFGEQTDSIAGRIVRSRGRETHFLRDPTHADFTTPYRGGLFCRGMREFRADKSRRIRGYDAFS